MTGVRPNHARPSAELITVRDWIRYANTELDRAPLHFGHGTDEAWDEAVALIGGWLRIPPDRLETMLDARVLAGEGEQLLALLRRRIDERVPVPYLVGRAWQVGLEFVVDERVLVPRSPIAQLLDDGLDPWLGDRVPRRILDLCTGSGCLGIVAALVFPEAEVVLADVSEDALAVAADNVRRFGLGDRVTTVASDGLEAFAGAEPFDLVICNPPYVNAADLAAMPAEFRAEPSLALAGGEDGLDPVARWLPDIARLLGEAGLLVLELGNSAPALLERFPALDVVWPELEQGGVGVVLVEREALDAGLL